MIFNAVITGELFDLDILRQKDLEQALILEEKMALQLKLLAAAGLSNVPDPPDYCHLVAEQADTGAMWKKVISAVQVNKPFQKTETAALFFLSTAYIPTYILYTLMPSSD